MSIKAILFDLDGTLLPMDQDTFAKAYIGGLGKAGCADKNDESRNRSRKEKAKTA